ncbi:PIN domain-containing protein [Klebsiella variicola]|uniref:PIN domain-containing protein n=1 Tax=Klebsiella variicola TaxID=244366 RepID=A0A7H4MAG9_KLEVA|nr:PIN domain-containing protein [Klebsiella variicola]
MTSGSALFDTNILIDLFSGRREAKQALEALATAECDQSDYLDGGDGWR